MHRSGTSLVAGLLAHSGVFLGDRLLAGGPGNPRGHFEEERVLAFHQRALRSRREEEPLRFDEGTLRRRPFAFEPTADEEREARALLAELERPGLWGWKDPRTCLFLPFWERLLPGVRLVVVFRHPLEVFESHLRRANNLDLAVRPGLIWDSYRVYNEAVLQAAERAPERALVVPAAWVAREPGLFLEAVGKRFGADDLLDPRGAEFARPGELAGGAMSEERHEMARALFPGAVAAFERLEGLVPPEALEATRRRPGAAGEKERLETLRALVSRSGLDGPEAVFRAVEGWLLSLSDEARASCRDRLFAAIEDEISERDRVLGEVRGHQEATAAHARETEETLTRIWEERNRFEGERNRLEGERNELQGERNRLEGERDDALRRTEEQWSQIRKQIAYARELEGAIGEKDAEIAELRKFLEESARRGKEQDERLRRAEERENAWRKTKSRRFFRLGRRLGLLDD